MKGHKESRGKDTWRLVLELGQNAKGERERSIQTFHGSGRQADAELVKQLNKLETGTYVDQTRITVGDYLEHWLANYAKPTVSERTYRRYSVIVRHHLIPGLGRHKLTKLKPIHIQAYYAEALEGGRVQRERKAEAKPKKTKDGEKEEERPRLKTLSAQTVKHHHRVLHQALKQAVRWRMIVVNPADAVQPPRPQPKQLHVLDAAGSVGLLRSLEGTRFYLPALLAVGTGMRRGEILGLRWADVDLDAGKLAVRQNLQQSVDGLVFKSPKTAKGQRSIPLLPSTLAVLKKHKREQAAQRLAMEAPYRNNDLVICEEDGSPWNPDLFSMAWRRKVTVKRGVRFHDLRHSHATMLLIEGVHPKVVQERLGHSNIGTTMDVYSHVMPNMQKQAADQLDAAFTAARAAAQEA